MRLDLKGKEIEVSVLCISGMIRNLSYDQKVEMNYNW